MCPWKHDCRLQKPVGVTQASVASWQAGSESHCSTHLDLYVVGSTLDSICIVQVISLLTQIFQQWFTRRKRITWLTRPITRFFTYGWFILRLSYHLKHSNIENNIRVGKVQNSFLFPTKLSCCRKWVCWREVGLAVHYLVSYPTRWSLLFIFGFLYGSSDISSPSKQQRNIVQLCTTPTADCVIQPCS